METGDLAAKTVNNALGTLAVCLNSAVEDGVVAVNPALRVQRLPPAHVEREYLRLEEIPRYIEACSDVYRPLAELLVGSGLRISESLALRIGDLELGDGRCDRCLPLAEGIRCAVDQVRSVPAWTNPRAAAYGDADAQARCCSTARHADLLTANNSNEEVDRAQAPAAGRTMKTAGWRRLPLSTSLRSIRITRRN